MDTQSYQVILEGSLRAGFEPSQAIKNLSALFKQDSGTVEKLLSGGPRVLKRGLNYETALRYQEAVEKAGADCRVEPQEPLQVAHRDPEQPAGGIDTVVEPQAGVCPRCGYQATRPDDVLLVRGDCPRCGLLVKKDQQYEDTTLLQAGTDFETESHSTGLYGEREPASWERRAYAAIYTFSLFLVVYCLLVLSFIFLFYPLERLHIHIGRDFLEIARTDYPMLMTALSILVVAFAMPLFIGGHTWGQKKFGIGVLFTEEARTGGILLSLTFRVAAIGLLSFAPGLIALRVAGAVGLDASIPSRPVTMTIMALLGWSAAWLVGPLRADKRGLLDIAAGAVQIDEGLIPLNPVKKALAPLAAVAGFVLVVGLILPLFFR